MCYLKARYCKYGEYACNVHYGLRLHCRIEISAKFLNFLFRYYYIILYYNILLILHLFHSQCHIMTFSPSPFSATNGIFKGMAKVKIGRWSKPGRLMGGLPANAPGVKFQIAAFTFSLFISFFGGSISSRIFLTFFLFHAVSFSPFFI